MITLLLAFMDAKYKANFSLLYLLTFIIDLEILELIYEIWKKKY